MKAPESLLAVLLLLSSTSLAQTSPPQGTAPTPPAAPAQQTTPTADSPQPEPAAQPATPSPSPAALTTSPDATAPTPTSATAPTVPAAPSAAPFAPGAKLFLEPMGGFEQFLSEAIIKRKVPVVVVKDGAQADFVLSGAARMKKPGWLTSMVLNTRGGGNISIQDVHTGNVVFACKFARVDQGLADGYIYEGWANNCARHLKKALQPK